MAKKKKKKIKNIFVSYRIVQQKTLSYLKENNLKIGKNWFKYVSSIYKNISQSGTKIDFFDKNFKYFFDKFSNYPKDKQDEDDLLENKKIDYVVYCPYFNINSELRESYYMQFVSKSIVFLLEAEFNDVNIEFEVSRLEEFSDLVIKYCRENGYNDSPIVDVQLEDSIIDENGIASTPVYRILFDYRNENEVIHYSEYFPNFYESDSYKKAIKEKRLYSLPKNEKPKEQPEPKKDTEKNISKENVDIELQKLKAENLKMEAENTKLKIELEKLKSKKDNDNDLKRELEKIKAESLKQAKLIEQENLKYRLELEKLKEKNLKLEQKLKKIKNKNSKK